MSFESAGADAPDHGSCNYGASRLKFRGPARRLDRPYVAFLGGSETYGRFVRTPFADLVEERLGMACVNLGCVNAGPDALAHDPAVVEIARNARLCVVQVLGAQNLSNRFYRVHPRRNDRFLEALPVLQRMFREVDFTEFHFNGHLLTALRKSSPARFARVREELQRAWGARMRGLIAAIGTPVVLLHIGHDPGGRGAAAGLGAEPALVEPWMLDLLEREGAGRVAVQVRTARQSGEMGDMICGALQVPAAEHMIGPGAHRAVANALAPDLCRRLEAGQ